jgi:hypothetical protein
MVRHIPSPRTLVTISNISDKIGGQKPMYDDCVTLDPPAVIGIGQAIVNFSIGVDLVRYSAADIVSRNTSSLGWIGSTKATGWESVASNALNQLNQAVSELQKVTTDLAPIKADMQNRIERANYLASQQPTVRPAPPESQDEDDGWGAWVKKYVDKVPIVSDIFDDGYNAGRKLRNGDIDLDTAITVASILPYGRIAKLGKYLPRGVKYASGSARYLSKGARSLIASLRAARVTRMERYADIARNLRELGYAKKDIADILYVYDKIADVPGASRLLVDLQAGNATAQGALAELTYIASLRQRGFEIEKVADAINGKKAADILLKDRVIDVKDYNWANPIYRNPAVVQRRIDQLMKQVDRLSQMEEYKGRKIEFAFTDKDHAPRELIEALESRGVEVTQVTWIK